MKKDKTVSTKRGRNFNIVLTVVALVLIVAVGGFATYSWVEQATTLNIDMNGTIQRVPGDSESRTEYYHQVNLSKTAESKAISLKDYVDKASDMMLSPVSSADGINFFMQKGDTYANSSPSGRNVSCLSFDFDVTSDTDTGIYFDNGLDSNNEPDTEDHPRTSFTFEGSPKDELESVRVAIQVNNDTPMIFSKSGGTNTGIADINGNTSATAPQIKKFSEYEFGKNPLFTLKKDEKTKVRITIWIEGTYENLGTEYQSGKTLNMKLMLTTPWNKAAVVKLVDKTANSMFNKGSGSFYLVDGTKDTLMTQTTEDDITYWSTNITGNQDSLTFKYVDDSTNYTWNATGRGDNFVYNIFDYGSTTAYGVWSPSPLQTEAINIKDCVVGTSLSTGTDEALDSHLKVSTDGTNYYRTAYDATKTKWTVNIDKNYSNLYVQYYSDGSAITAKWNATEGRTNKETQTTYYLLDTEGGTTSDSLGSWVDEYNVYFYDGTVDQITAKTGTTIAYEAFSGETKVSYGSVDKDSSATYRFVAEKQLKYSDKIDKVVFTLSRLATNGKDEIKYTWNGNGKVNKDIYYTANSYTKD